MRIGLPISCWKVRTRMLAFVDGRLRDSERKTVLSHMRSCQDCAHEIEGMLSVSRALNGLPAAPVPSGLHTSLRVVASRECQAVAQSLGSPLRRAFEAWCFRLDQLMRPFTVPAAGGILSTLCLFSLLASSINSRAPIVSYEVPVDYADRNIANLVPIQLRSSMIMILSLDGRGRITDYSVHDREAAFVGDPGRLQYHNLTFPDFPGVPSSRNATVNRGISIQFEPILFRR